MNRLTVENFEQSVSVEVRSAIDGGFQSQVTGMGSRCGHRSKQIAIHEIMNGIEICLLSASICRLVDCMSTVSTRVAKKRDPRGRSTVLRLVVDLLYNQAPESIVFYTGTRATWARGAVANAC